MLPKFTIVKKTFELSLLKIIKSFFQAASENEGQLTLLTSNLQRCERLLDERHNEVSGLQAALEGAQSLNIQLQTSADQQTRELSQQMNDSVNRVSFG